MSEINVPMSENPETVDKMKQEMASKVEGEIEYGQPVEVHVRRYEDSPLRKYLTYYGWFRGSRRVFSGEMEKCMKEMIPEEKDSEKNFRLCNLALSTINPDDVEKIIPLKSVDSTEQ